jgi:hypothetical protein
MWCGMGGWNVFLFLYLSCLAVNNLGAEGAGRLEEPLGRAAIVVTTSTWCSLDTWMTGNEESHTLHPFKERVCGFKLPCKKGSLNHNCRFPNRLAEDTHDILSSVALLALHVKYFIVITSSLFLHPHPHCLLYHQAASSHTNGLLHLCIIPAFPRTNNPFVNLPVPWRRGRKKPPR